MPAKRAILFVTSWYPNEDDPTLGIFVRRHAQAVGLFEKISVMYVRKGTADTMKVRNEGNITEFYIEYSPSILPTFISYLIAFNKAIRKICQIEKPSVIHSHVIMPAGALAARFAKRKGIPHVITEHWTGYLKSDGNYKGSLQTMLTRSAVRDSKLIMPVSDDLKKAMLSHKLEGRYEVVYNVADPVFFKAERKQGGHRFLHVSSLDQRQKNITGILNAFKKLQEQIPDATLILAGDGHDRDSAVRYTQQEGIKNVSFPGNLSSEQLAQLLTKSAALVMFSNFENLPCVIIESLAAGVPVISTDTGGIAEILTNADGILIKPGDEAALTSAMRSVITSDHFNSADIRQRASDRFSYDTIGKKISSLYNSIAG